MAMTFNSVGCQDAANKLNVASTQLDRILNTDLNNTITSTRNIYTSDTAEKLYSTYNTMKAKFPDFIGAIKACSDHLNVVAEQYSKVENTAASKL